MPAVWQKEELRKLCNHLIVECWTYQIIVSGTLLADNKSPPTEAGSLLEGYQERQKSSNSKNSFWAFKRFELIFSEILGEDS